MRRNRRYWSLTALGLLTLAGCGEDPAGADPAIAPFVGTWDATVYQIWPDLNPSFVVDVLSAFGPFYISIEPSGQYTAVLEAQPVPQVQIGQLSVLGSTIRLDVTTPPGEPSNTGNYSFTSPSQLVLDGPVSIDFNDDGTDDPGGSHIELRRRP